MITDQDIVDVASEDWHAQCRLAASEGCASVDWLTAVDQGDRLQILVHLVQPGTTRHTILRTSLPSEEPLLASLQPDFPGVDWHEREVSEMFAVTFQGRVETASLLLRQEPTVPPMRKTTPLTERVDTPWPGEEPNRRRRKPAPGVRPEWMASDE